jgi:hypothetical protein
MQHAQERKVPDGHRRPQPQAPARSVVERLIARIKEV